MNKFLLSFFIISCISLPKFLAQQNYSGNSVLDCDQNDAAGPSSAFLYSCNGQKSSCQAFLIFKSQPPYDTVSTISNLMSAEPSELARINNFSKSTVLPPDKEVIVPVFCSCSGEYYQANTSYIIPSIYDTYFTIANDTYQGLSTCNSLLRENNYSAVSLVPGLGLRVLLRCACPTSEQTANGTKFLLTYVINWGDHIPDVSRRFNASPSSVAYSNGFAEDEAVIFPFTTILVPLSTEPSSSQTIIHHPPHPPPPPPSLYNSPPSPVHGKVSSREKIFLWIGMGISLIFPCFVLLFFWHHKRRSEGAEERTEKRVLPKDFLVHVAEVDQVLRVYDFEDIKVATGNFSAGNKMGGSVYRGVLNGELLAIKQMSKDVDKEVSLLKRINHFNLIRLYGACEDQGVFYLLYEFMENGCLKEWLQKKSSPEAKIWNYRILIALDVATGLHYLHNFSNPSYVHKDICSDNVLLNRDLRAKIANFSLARSAEREESRESSGCGSVGTKGYIAPEYMEYGLETPEMDVYAFGVVLLELTTGKEAVFMLDGKEVLLSERILTVMEGENAEAELESFIDPCLLGSHLWMELARRMIKLSVCCLAQEPESRLSIAEVVSTLLRIQLDAQRSEPMSLEWR